MPDSVTDSWHPWTEWEPKLNRVRWQFVAQLQWKLTTYAMEIDAYVRWLIENRALLDRHTRWAAICEAGTQGVDLHLFLILRSRVEITFSGPPIELGFANASVRIQNYDPPNGIADYLVDVRDPGVILTPEPLL
jgi:hypothetical protein